MIRRRYAVVNGYFSLFNHRQFSGFKGRFAGTKGIFGRAKVA
jgi:hypothetical protein